MASNYIRPDMLSRVPIIGGELTLSPGYDVIHVFRPLGAVMLKYWNTDGGGMSNVLMSEEQGMALGNIAGLAVVERPFILATEHEQLIKWQADQMRDSDFGF